MPLYELKIDEGLVLDVIIGHRRLPCSNGMLVRKPLKNKTMEFKVGLTRLEVEREFGVDSYVDHTTSVECKECGNRSYFIGDPWDNSGWNICHHCGDPVLIK